MESSLRSTERCGTNRTGNEDSTATQTWLVDQAFFINMVINQSLLHDIVVAIDFEATKKQESTVVMESQCTFTGQASTSRLQGTCLYVRLCVIRLYIPVGTVTLSSSCIWSVCPAFLSLCFSGSSTGVGVGLWLLPWLTCIIQ